MKNRQIRFGLGKAMRRLGRAFSEDLPKKNLLRINLKYAATSIAISVFAFALLGLNVWVILLALFFQSIYFFGQNITNKMFKFLFVNLVIILLCGLLYNIFINQAGLTDQWQSQVRFIKTKIGLDLDHPTDSLEKAAQALIRKKADELYRENQNNFSGLLAAHDSINQMRNQLYNKVYNKTFPEQDAQGRQTANSQLLKVEPVSQDRDYYVKYQQAINEGYQLVTSMVLDSGQAYNCQYKPGIKLRMIYDKPVKDESDNIYQMSKYSLETRPLKIEATKNATNIAVFQR